MLFVQCYKVNHYFWIDIDNHWWVPILLIVVQTVLSLVACRILVEVKYSTNMGSFQEIAYYLTNDRPVVVFIGLHVFMTGIVNAGLSANLTAKCFLYTVIYPLIVLFNNNIETPAEIDTNEFKI